MERRVSRQSVQYITPVFGTADNLSDLSRSCPKVFDCAEYTCLKTIGNVVPGESPFQLFNFYVNESILKSQIRPRRHEMKHHELNNLAIA